MMSTNGRLGLAASCGLAALVAGLAVADGIPTMTPLTYSGVLQNSAGIPVTGSQAMQLTLWDDATANASVNQKCVTPTQNVALDGQGRFVIVLDQACFTAVRENANLWVQIQTGAVVLPRVKLTATPYSVAAGNGVPVGSILPFAGENLPPDWYPCDGRLVTVVTDSRLCAVLGASWGAAPTGSCKLPDLRGQFLRGAHGPTIDPAGDRAVGSDQDSDNRSHSHTMSWARGTAPGSGIPDNHTIYRFPGVPQVDMTPWIVIGGGGGPEARPINKAVNYIIKR
jgi:hypothetical protein